MALTMSVGRDYRFHGRYEFVIFEGDMVVHREGAFRSSTAAKRAGLRAAQRLAPEPDPTDLAYEDQCAEICGR